MSDSIQATVHIKSWHADSVIRRIHNASKRALKGAAIRARNRAKSYTPVDTGRLRDSIKEGSVTEESGGKLAISVGSDVEYALFVEFGTVYMQGHFMLTRAVDQTLGELKGLLGSEITSASDNAVFFLPSDWEGLR